MLISAREVLKTLEFELHEIENSNEESFLKINNCLEISKRHCEKLLQKIVSYEFETIEEQIEFFKKVKPAYFSLYFYYDKIRKIESKCIGKGKLGRKRIIVEELGKKIQFFDNNQDLYNYYRTGNSECDSKYFSKFNTSEMKFMGQKWDEIMFSSHDIIFSRFIAYEQVEVYLSDELQKLLSSNCIDKKRIDLKEVGICWTGSLRDFVELISTLHLTKVINNGNLSLKEIFEISLFMFNLDYDVKDIYLARNQLKQRKKSESSFIEKLKNVKLDEDNFFE